MLWKFVQRSETKYVDPIKKVFTSSKTRQEKDVLIIFPFFPKRKSLRRKTENLEIYRRRPFFLMIAQPEFVLCFYLIEDCRNAEAVGSED